MTATKIEWAEAVWNPLAGCTVHSPGCTNCYAMRMAYRLEAMAREQMMLRESPLAHYCGTTRKVNGKAVWTGTVNLSEAALLAPLRRNKPTRYFVNSMSDLFHESVPDEQIDRIFAVMALCPQHTFLPLTKRSARMREYVDSWSGDWSRIDAIWFEINKLVKEGAPLDPKREIDLPLPNVWLGVSVEDQTRADERIPDLLATPAAVRWISAEPLLGPLDLRMLHYDNMVNIDALTGDHGVTLPLKGRGPGLGWVVAGGESGPGARGSIAEVEANMRRLRDQCQAAGVPFFAKQGFKKHPLPEDLMVREYPA